MVRLVGKKCILRSVESSDVGTILLWENDPDLAQFSDPHQTYSAKQIEQFIVNQQLGFKDNGQIRLMIEVKGRAVGAIDLFDNRNFVSLYTKLSEYLFVALLSGSIT